MNFKNLCSPKRTLAAEKTNVTG